ncbi:P-loop containing nucleoside triphosphate hydrolase protein [Chlamydoabsidia padenii]|nr:P-loop containing nucleoside triphosphate hydrolase protein [Chlamydoabsidia padenii]
MLSRVVLATLTRQRYTGVVSQRFPRLSCLQYGLGNKFDRSLIKLRPSSWHTVATLTSQSNYQPTTLDQLSVDPHSPDKLQDDDKTCTRFDQLDTLHPSTQLALRKVFKYEDMTSVQSAVLSRLPNETDMFVKAKTGTGKTLAFLVAALETSLANRSRHNGTCILVISPTRELANQIAEEAKKLVKYHHGLGVRCLVGGDSIQRQTLQLTEGRCDIVVGTPGRLNGMLSSVPHLKQACQHLKVLVLDEADQLIDMGFKDQVQSILDHLPRRRQTMLFSATAPRQHLGAFALNPHYDMIDTIGDDDINTHLHIKQSALVVPYQDQLQIIQHLLEHHKAAKSGKVIIFLPTTKQTMIYAQLFKYLMPQRLTFDMHSGKSQDDRTRISRRFRKSRGGILVTSDVSARGVDYPDVDLVVQIGIPHSREQYIHRLGRTGRGGRQGEGILVMAPFEKRFISRQISDMPIEETDPPALNEIQCAINSRAIDYALKELDDDGILQLYTGYIGYYCERMPELGIPRSYALQAANQFLGGLGYTDFPYLSQKFKQRLGLTNSRFDNRRRQSRYDDDDEQDSSNRVVNQGRFRYLDQDEDRQSRRHDNGRPRNDRSSQGRFERRRHSRYDDDSDNHVENNRRFVKSSQENDQDNDYDNRPPTTRFHNDDRFNNTRSGGKDRFGNRNNGRSTRFFD